MPNSIPPKWAKWATLSILPVTPKIFQQGEKANHVFGFDGNRDEHEEQRHVGESHAESQHNAKNGARGTYRSVCIKQDAAQFTDRIDDVSIGRREAVDQMSIAYHFVNTYQVGGGIWQ